MAEVAVESREEMQCQLPGYRHRKANFISVISPLSAGMPALFPLTLGGGQTRHKFLIIITVYCNCVDVF